MGKFGKMQGVMHLSCGGVLHTSQSDPRGFGARIEFEHDWLRSILFLPAIPQSDRERHHAMDYRSFAGKQQARPLFRARHERVFPSIQDKHGHNKFLSFLPLKRPTYVAGDAPG